MSKELKALNRIKDFMSVNAHHWKQDIRMIETALKVLEIIESKITAISFNYGGKMGNVIQLRIGCDTCYLHFDENDKNFDLLKEGLK